MFWLQAHLFKLLFDRGVIRPLIVYCNGNHGMQAVPVRHCQHACLHGTQAVLVGAECEQPFQSCSERCQSFVGVSEAHRQHQGF